MTVLGIVFVVFGIISVVAGKNINNDMDRQLRDLFESGEINQGDVFVYLGYGLIILGVLFIIIGIVKNGQKDNYAPMRYNMPSAPAFKCFYCGYRGNYSKVCPICRSKQSMVMLENNEPSSDNFSSAVKTRDNICPNCGAAVSSGNIFCGKCGSRIVGTQKCSKCGAEQTAGSAFCVNCGNKLNS